MVAAIPLTNETFCEINVSMQLLLNAVRILHELWYTCMMYPKNIDNLGLIWSKVLSWNIYRTTLTNNYKLCLAIFYRFYSLNVVELTVFWCSWLIRVKKEMVWETTSTRKYFCYISHHHLSRTTQFKYLQALHRPGIEALASEEIAHRLTWGRFVN